MHQIIYVQGHQIKGQNKIQEPTTTSSVLCPPLKIYQLMSQGARLDCRREIPNRDLILLFLKWKLHLPIYNQSHQPMNIEGDQAECQSYCWLLLMPDVLV